jgi:hypothetical protein
MNAAMCGPNCNYSTKTGSRKSRSSRRGSSTRALTAEGWRRNVHPIDFYAQ